MALRPDRDEHLTDLSFFMNEAAQRGIIVVADTAGSGAAMDNANAVVKIPVSHTADVESGNPAGLLLNDVVNLDLTRQHINYAKDEMQLGGKVLLLRRGTVVTDMISGTPTVGERAYFWLNGQLCGHSDAVSMAVSGAQIGRWLSTQDPDGFAKVAIDII